jgi:hypothetical protein
MLPLIFMRQRSLLVAALLVFQPQLEHVTIRRYPRTGAQVHLRAPIMKPGKDNRLEFIVFGGGFADVKLNEELTRCSHIGCDKYAAQWRLCVSASVRIGLRVTASGGHVFDDRCEVTLLMRLQEEADSLGSSCLEQILRALVKQLFVICTVKRGRHGNGCQMEYG